MSPAAAIVDARGVSRGARGSSADDDEDEGSIILFKTEAEARAADDRRGASSRGMLCLHVLCDAVIAPLFSRDVRLT